MQVAPPPVPALPQARVQPPPPLLSAGAEVSLAPDRAEFPGKVMDQLCLHLERDLEVSGFALAFHSVNIFLHFY